MFDRLLHGGSQVAAPHDSGVAVGEAGEIPYRADLRAAGSSRERVMFYVILAIYLAAGIVAAGISFAVLWDAHGAPWDRREQPVDEPWREPGYFLLNERPEEWEQAINRALPKRLDRWQ